MESKGNGRLTCGCDGNDLDQFGKCPHYTKSDWAEVEGKFVQEFEKAFGDTDGVVEFKTEDISDWLREAFRRHLEAAREEAIREHDAIWHPVV